MELLTSSSAIELFFRFVGPCFVFLVGETVDSPTNGFT